LEGINDGRDVFHQLLAVGFDENWIGEPSAVLLRRSTLERVALFNERLFQIADLELWARIAYDHRLGFIDRVLSVYRHHELSGTAENARIRRDWFDKVWLFEGSSRSPVSSRRTGGSSARSGDRLSGRPYARKPQGSSSDAGHRSSRRIFATAPCPRSASSGGSTNGLTGWRAAPDDLPNLKAAPWAREPHADRRCRMIVDELEPGEGDSPAGSPRVREIVARTVPGRGASVTSPAATQARMCSGAEHRVIGDVSVAVFTSRSRSRSAIRADTRRSNLPARRSSEASSALKCRLLKRPVFASVRASARSWGTVSARWIKEATWHRGDGRVRLNGSIAPLLPGVRIGVAGIPASHQNVKARASTM
jgi:hypothetical protein